MSERLEIYTDPTNGRTWVFGATVIGAICMLLGLLMNQPLLVLITITCFAVALYKYPMLRSTRPQVIAAREGLTLDGLGRIRWNSIRSLTFDGQSILCHLDPDFEEAINVEETETALRSIQFHVWHRIEADQVRIDLKHLRGTPKDLFARIEALHKEVGGE